MNSTYESILSEEFATASQDFGCINAGSNQSRRWQRSNCRIINVSNLLDSEPDKILHEEKIHRETEKMCALRCRTSLSESGLHCITSICSSAHLDSLHWIALPKGGPGLPSPSADRLPSRSLSPVDEPPLCQDGEMEEDAQKSTNSGMTRRADHNCYEEAVWSGLVELPCLIVLAEQCA